MEFDFLKTEVEGYALFAAVVVYLIGIILILSRYLKIIRNTEPKAETLIRKKKKIYLVGFFGMLFCAMMHTALFHLFFESIPPRTPLRAELRTSYYFSILITFLVFLTVLLFGFYLRGTSTLPKQKGPVTGV